MIETEQAVVDDLCLDSVEPVVNDEGGVSFVNSLANDGEASQTHTTARSVDTGLEALPMLHILVKQVEHRNTKVEAKVHLPSIPTRLTTHKIEESRNNLNCIP